MLELARKYRIALYALLFAAAFLIALWRTFPVDALRDRLVTEAAAQGWQVKVVEVGTALPLGVRMSDLIFESRDGLRVPVEEIRATLRLAGLLLGRRGVDYQVKVFDGRVRGLAEETRSARRLTASVSGIDLSRLGALRRATGLELGGKLDGELELALDSRELTRSTGKLDLRVEKLAVLGGRLELASLGGPLTLPRADLGRLVAQGQMKEGRAVLDKLEARGTDLEVVGEGLAITLQPRFAYSAVFGRVRLKLADAWRPPIRVAAEAALSPARGRDGAYWFQLYGTVSQPLARPGP